ncbi:MAG: methyltransferase domain-containing protein [Meiothermus sp.]|nr:methyltransferase domain-containing protein [Meiothermus sp.]
MDKTQRTYDQFAAVYDDTNAAMPDGLKRAAAQFLGRLPKNPHCVDVGCGVGRDMAWLKTHGAVITGVNFSIGMLARARTRVRGELIQMDMHSGSHHYASLREA